MVDTLVVFFMVSVVILLSVVVFLMFKLKKVLKPLLKLAVQFTKAYNPELSWKTFRLLYAIFAALRGEKEYLSTFTRPRPLETLGETEEVIEDEAF